MVEITVIIEGGTVNADTAAVQIVDNVSALRQSLNRIFSELLGENVSIIVQPGAGYRNAALQFLRNNKQAIFLYVDLDDKRENIAKWFDKIKDENPNRPIEIPEQRRQYVFFMIQEMEAWILKQPSAIDKWGTDNGYIRLYQAETIGGHSLIAGKDIESIEKPSEVLYNVIKHFFKREHNGKKKKIHYGKLKSAPSLLDRLDVAQLLDADSELQRFRETVMSL